MLNNALKSSFEKDQTDHLESPYMHALTQNESFPYKLVHNFQV